MRKKLKFTVSETDEDKRVDVYIHEQIPSLSRNQIKGIIQAGQLHIAYKAVNNFGDKVKKNDIVSIDYDPEENYKYRAKRASRKIEVIADTPDYIVIEKDFAIPSYTNKKHIKTAFQYINDYIKQKKNKRYNQVFPVVSLDKNLSGLMCVAKSEMKQKQITGKNQPYLRYLAIVEGDLTEQQGELFHPNRTDQQIHFKIRKTVKKIIHLELSTQLYELNPIIDFLDFNGLKLKFIQSHVRNKLRPLIYSYQIQIQMDGKKLVQYQVRIPDHIYS